MNTDWQLIIGYEWPEAEVLLREEGVDFEVLISRPPPKADQDYDPAELRVIAVRHTAKSLTVICAALDWTISKGSA